MRDFYGLPAIACCKHVSENFEILNELGFQKNWKNIALPCNTLRYTKVIHLYDYHTVIVTLQIYLSRIDAKNTIYSSFVKKPLLKIYSLFNT